MRLFLQKYCILTRDRGVVCNSLRRMFSDPEEKGGKKVNFLHPSLISAKEDFYIDSVLARELPIAIGFDKIKLAVR